MIILIIYLVIGCIIIYPVVKNPREIIETWDKEDLLSKICLLAILISGIGITWPLIIVCGIVQAFKKEPN